MRSFISFLRIPPNQRSPIRNLAITDPEAAITALADLSLERLLLVEDGCSIDIRTQDGRVYIGSQAAHLFNAVRLSPGVEIQNIHSIREQANKLCVVIGEVMVAAAIAPSHAPVHA